MDFNLIAHQRGENVDNIEHMVKKSFSFGYKCVALNTVIWGSDLKEKTVKIPEPPEHSLCGYNTDLKILTRLTVIMDDNSQGHHLMQNPVVKKYDIIAIQPIGEKMLQNVCGEMDVDLISFNFEEKLNFSLKRTYLGQAIEKGTCFEIMYSPCLRDQTARRTIISNAQILLDVTKSRNIVISSGALKTMEIRGIEDVANLGLLFGFKRDQAKDAVCKSGQKVLAHSGTRKKTGCGFVSVQDMFKLAKQDKWLIDACRIPKDSDSESTSKKRVCDQDYMQNKSKKRPLKS